jgi:SPP1 family predicted phage head-tail adaptor
MPVLKHTVTIQQPSGSAGADGHFDETSSSNWDFVADRKAKITTRSGSEGYRFNQVQADISHIVEMRSDSLTRTIAAGWRLVFGSRVLDIRAAYDVDEMRQTVRCDCTEHL